MNDPQNPGTTATRPADPPPRHRLLTRLFAPVDVASLVCFRILFGLVMVWEVYRYVRHGWIQEHFIEPEFYFKYYGFDWVQPWTWELFGVPGMVVHFAVLGALSVCLMLGIYYRLTTILFFLTFTYVYLLDQAQHLNHLYLVATISFLMIFLPCHRGRSFDARRNSKLRAPFAPAWCLWLLQAQIGIVYLYAGFAKLNGDWLRGYPLRMWLAERDMPVIGQYFAQAWCAYAFSYGGLLLDLLVFPALLWRRSRPFAFAAAVAFHLTNSILFNIGIFPWFMIVATLIFFPPDWPRRVLLFLGPLDQTPDEGIRQLRLRHWITVGLLAAFLAFQVLFPLRHLLYPGVVHWTEEGHRFSWHMKLRDKSSDTCEFVAYDPDEDNSWTLDPLDDLTARQLRKMSGRPDMILQYAHHLRDAQRAAGYPRVQIRADVHCSLNGREFQRLIDPDIDLAQVERDLWPAAWILPLTVPLDQQR